MGLQVAHPPLYKVAHQRGLNEADGDEALLQMDDAHGDGGVDVVLALQLHPGQVAEDQGLVFVGFDTAALLLVQGGA